MRDECFEQMLPAVVNRVEMSGPCQPYPGRPLSWPYISASSSDVLVHCTFLCSSLRV